MKKCWFFGLFVFIFMLTHTPQGLFSQAKPARINEDRASSYWSRFKFELTTAVSYQKSLLDSSYFHQYSPPFLSGAYESLADHTIKIRGRDGWGFNAGLAYFPLHNFGLQFLVDYTKPKLSGANTQYDVWLNYALSFDASPPYPYIFEYTYGWPETAGHLTEVCLSLNGAFRLPIFKRLALYLSGGLTYFHVDGEGTGLAYSKYWWDSPWFLGDTYNVKFKFGPIKSLGLNLGAELNWVLFSNMCFVLEGRYFDCPSSTLPMNIINEGLATAPPFDVIKPTMNLQKLTVNPSFYRINLGLKYLF
jgi:hypothetical protein